MTAKTDAERQAAARQRREQERSTVVAMLKTLQTENAALRAELNDTREKLHRAQLRLAKLLPTKNRSGG